MNATSWIPDFSRLPDDGRWLVAFRSGRASGGIVAARWTGRNGPIQLDAEAQNTLRRALPHGARLVACRAVAILHDDAGIRVADGPEGAPLADGEPDAGMPDLFCTPEVALGLPTGAWRLDPNALSAHARLALTRALGPIPEGHGAAWVVRCRAGAVWGRADPRFLPEAVARA